MFYLNKAIWTLANPTVALLALGALCLVLGVKKHWGIVLLALAWLWATPLTTRILGLPLEREWLVDGKVPRVESFEKADAIVCLGGGMGGDTNVSDYAEMWMGADRVWQAARLWKAGKAPKIICTGEGCRAATAGLLADFGIPTSAMVFLEKARNTEEEAKEIAVVGSCSCRKVLLVTSAWHMRRAKQMFERYASEVEVVPAPADFETAVRYAKGFQWTDLLPSGQAIMDNEYLFHEWLGSFGYEWFR